VQAATFDFLLYAPSEFIEMLPVAAYACDADGRVLWFNRRAEALWGRAPRVGDDTELFCGSYKVHFDGRQISRAETPMAHAIRTGEAVDGREGVVERPDGTRVRAMVHIAPVKDPAGRVLGAINCFHDVTELHDAKARAAESDERFRQLIEALPAAVYTTDADGCITYYNKAAALLAGREPQLGSDKWCVTWRLYNPDGTPLPHEQCPMAVALKENRPVRNVEALAERPDGTLVPFIPFPTPLHNRKGEIVGAVNMLIDISERKQAETHQMVLLKELNHRVKNNMQMLQALLYAAHRETSDPKARTLFEDAMRRVTAMAAAQRVLHEEGKPGSFSAEDFIESVCRAVRASVDKEVKIAIDAAPAFLSNEIAMPLALILNELLTNAVKYGLGDTGEVRVIFTADKDNCELRVEDRGPGFTLTHRATRTSSGLGLVTGLARQIGGRLDVESEQGARCIIRFPARRGSSR
jgi:PAS domain S-box-containing protein